MANYTSIAATGKSIERLLGACFRADQPVSDGPTTAALVHTEDFDLAAGTVVPPAVSVYLYRVEPNAVMRATTGELMRVHVKWSTGAPKSRAVRCVRSTGAAPTSPR